MMERIAPEISRVELEKLNAGTNEINKLEKELDKANTKFRQLLNRTTGELESLGKKIGSCIEKARPFYQALAKAQNAHRACVTASGNYQRANDIHSQAKALVKQAEIRNPKSLDSAWQEVLNHATMKVMEAEEMKKSSELEHRLRAEDFTRAEKILHELEKNLGREIDKSRPYFQLKDKLNSDLQSVKTEIENLQKSIFDAKLSYSNSLKSLELISEEIHERRSVNSTNSRSRSRSHNGGMRIRTPGVGAEETQTNETQTSSSTSSASASSSPLTSLSVPHSHHPGYGNGSSSSLSQVQFFYDENENDSGDGCSSSSNNKTQIIETNAKGDSSDNDRINGNRNRNEPIF